MKKADRNAKGRRHIRQRRGNGEAEGFPFTISNS
jgi:hypothetical protein